jgi:4-carboxymuconolactone decarboxylase
MPSTDRPRIPPLPQEAQDETTRELLSSVGPFADNHVFTTMVRHPRLFKRWVPYGTAMLYARLPARDRELLILRTSHRCRCAYEWAHHCEAAPTVGITEAEINLVKRGPDEDAWAPFDAALVRAVDELLDHHLIGDATWATLAERYDESLLIEVLMVIGHYLALAGTLNSLRVQLEPPKTTKA